MGVGESGEAGDIRVSFATLREVQTECVEWALDIADDFVPDLVVFLAKSGFLFAQPLSACFDCMMVDLEVSRPSNGGKDILATVLPFIPRILLAAALKSRMMYGYHGSNPQRNLVRTERYKSIDFTRFSKILIVDDSVDTGWSMHEAEEAVRVDAPHCEVKVASFCVISGSESRAHVDYWRYENAIVVSATSRYSSEHRAFVEAYESWKDGISRHES